VAKVEWHPGELYPRVGFIVTNLARPAERIVANRTFLRRYQESSARVFKVFHACPIVASIEPWQHGYLSFVLGLMKFNGGFPEWDDFYEWVIGSILPMMTSGSGWCRQVPTKYFYNILTQPQESNLTVANAGQGEYDAITCASWADAFDFVAAKRAEDGPAREADRPQRMQRFSDLSAAIRRRLLHHRAGSGESGGA
jgi:hypothetical protein